MPPGRFLYFTLGPLCAMGALQECLLTHECLFSMRKCHQRVMWSQASSPWALSLSLSWETSGGTPSARRSAPGVQMVGGAAQTWQTFTPPLFSYTICNLEYFKTAVNCARACSGQRPGKSQSNMSGKMLPTNISLSCPQLLQARPWNSCKPGEMMAMWKKRKHAGLLWDGDFI